MIYGVAMFQRARSLGGLPGSRCGAVSALFSGVPASPAVLCLGLWEMLPRQRCVPPVSWHIQQKSGFSRIENEIREGIIFALSSISTLPASQTDYHFYCFLVSVGFVSEIQIEEL